MLHRLSEIASSKLLMSTMSLILTQNFIQHQLVSTHSMITMMDRSNWELLKVSWRAVTRKKLGISLQFQNHQRSYLSKPNKIELVLSHLIGQVIQGNNLLSKRVTRRLWLQHQQKKSDLMNRDVTPMLHLPRRKRLLHLHLGQIRGLLMKSLRIKMKSKT